MSALFLVVLCLIACGVCWSAANAQTKQAAQAQDPHARSQHARKAKLLKAAAVFLLVVILSIAALIALFFALPRGH